VYAWIVYEIRWCLHKSSLCFYCCTWRYSSFVILDTTFHAHVWRLHSMHMFGDYIPCTCLATTFHAHVWRLHSMHMFGDYIPCTCLATTFHAHVWRLNHFCSEFSAAVKTAQILVIYFVEHWLSKCVNLNLIYLSEIKWMIYDPKNILYCSYIIILRAYLLYLE